MVGPLSFVLAMSYGVGLGWWQRRRRVATTEGVDMSQNWERIESEPLRDALRAFAASAEHLRDVWENLHGLSPDHDAMCVGYPTSWESFEEVAFAISIWCDSALTGEDPVKWYGGDVA